MKAISVLTGLSYVPLPLPPSKAGGTLLTSGMGSSITQAELGGGVTKGLVPATWTNTLRTNQLVGSSGTPYIFRPDSDTDYATIDGTALASGSNLIGQTGATISDWVEWHKLIAVGNTGVGSMTGFKWVGKAGGSNALVSDCVFADAQSPNMQFNGNGNAGTYGDMRMYFCRAIGSNTDNEAFYFGDTSTTLYGVINTLTLKHLFGYNKGWDGLQLNSIQNLSCRNGTLYTVGTAGASGQKSLLQAQNIGNGAVIENMLFWGAPKAFQVAARDITFRKCIFYSDEEGFYQDVVTDAGYASPLSSVGGTILFDQCEFYSSTPRSVGFTFYENNANLTMTNCKKGSNITNLYSDNRISFTYTISETGTTTGTAITPTFLSLAYTDPLIHGLVTNPYYRYNGIGYRNGVN